VEEQDWEVDLLDPRDSDERSVLNRLAHPQLDEAIGDGQDQVTTGGEPTNPRPHLMIHEVVAAQLVNREPPEVFATARRLLELRVGWAADARLERPRAIAADRSSSPARAARR
jgi:hypothetical protein